MALTRNESPRADKLAALGYWYCIEIRDTIDSCENSAEEDLFMHLFNGENGEDAEPIHRWCAVTRGGEYTFLYPLFDTREEAEERTIEYPDDDIYSESPVAVVDLDGETTDHGDVFVLTKLIAVFSTDAQS